MVAPEFRTLVLLLLILTVAASALAADAEAQSVPFGKTSLQGANVVNPTSLQFGPDGRLYVAQRNGLIKVLTVQRNGAFNYSVTASEVISLVQQIPNHDDNGTPNPSITERLITGILVVGTASEPVLYVSSSDPRIAIEEDTNLDTNSGIISRLTRTGVQWEKQDLVRGLPRNEENHSPNGMALDGSTLYLAQGGHTNMGAPSNSFAYQPEYALSGAILSIDLSTIGSTTYDLPTLDDPTRANVGAEDDGDPFGGNDGLNQAKLLVGGPVQIYSPGYRNAFDLVITSTPGREGRMYTIDNGPNNNWGGPPINEGPTGNCTAEPNELGTNSYSDNLHFVTGPGYYGGHPNPMRGNPGGAGLYDETGTPIPFPSDWPAVPLSEANPVECDYRIPGVEDGSLSQWPFSTNGMTEYTATTFEGDLLGDLLAAGFNNTIQRVQLTEAGDAATATTTLFSNVGDLPLDVTAQGDADPFPGTIWVADFTAAGGQIYVFEPASGTCDLSDPTADADGDGYTNEDELDNGVDPCSGADVPPDRDGDFISDINDADDDNDGTPDVTDPFVLDDQNGLTTTMPIDYTWFGGEPGFGFFNLGFTGLMYNGSTEYLTLYDPTNITAGGAAGKFTIDEVPSGDAVANSQQYGFLFGVNVQGVTESFTAHTSIQAPFSGIVPEDFQSMGLFIGTGDQDNYVKVVTTAKQGGRVEVGGEIDGSTFSFNADASIIGSTNTQLYITVEPSSSTVQASYSVNGGPRYPFGDPVSIPRSWFDGTDALAVGLISTSSGPGPEFTATWEHISVEPTSALAPEGLWTQVPSFNDATARHENGFVFGGRFFYLLGGRGTRPVERYDPEKDEWTFLSNAPTEMHHFQAVENDGLIYIVAGLQGGGTNETGLSNIYIFDPSSNTWSVGPEIPEARRRGSTGVAVYQDKFYIVGGLTGAHGEAGTAFAYFDEFDPATNTWTVLPDAPRVRDHFHAVLVEDEIFVIGGRNSGVSGFLNATIPEIDVYNFTTGQWRTLPSGQNLPLPRAAAATGRFEDDIILSGGEGPNGPYVSTEAYNLTTQTWRSLQDAPTPRHGTQAIVHKNGFYVAAGSNVLGGGGEAAANILEALYMGEPEQPSGSAIKAGPLNVPPGVAFGTVSVGSGSTQSVTLTNGGNEQGIVIGALTVGSDPAAPGGEAAFSVTPPYTLPVVLRPGASLPVDVTFNPTEGGTKQALLNVQRSGESNPVAIPLSGTGAADLTATPGSLTFGSVEVGTTSTSQNVVIANDSGASLSVTGVSTSSPFMISAAPSFPVTLATGASLNISVAFAPTAAGTQTGTLSITSDTGSSLSVALSGEGVLSSSAGLLAEYDFVPDGNPQVLVDRSGQGRNGQIGSTSGSDANDPVWTDVGLQFDGTNDYAELGDLFDVTETQDQTILIYLRPDTQHLGDLFVKRTPSDAAFYYLRQNTDGLRVQYRDAAGTDVVNGSLFSGAIAGGAFVMASTRLDNGTNLSTGLHTVAGSQYVSEAIVPSRSFENSAAARFGALVQFGQIFNAFDGTMAYARVYNRILTTSELDLAYAEITQIVNGRIGDPSAPTLSASPTSVDFGTADVGISTNATSITLVNGGTSALTITAIDLSGTNAGDFMLSGLPTLPLTLEAGGTGTVDVTFIPSSSGPKAAQIDATYDQPASPLVVELTGEGLEGQTGGLLAEYDFVPGADPQVLVDRSGQGNNGVLGSSSSSDANDPIWSTAGLVFDGTNDFVDLGDRFDVTETDDQTVLLFFLPETAHTGDLWVKRTGSDPAFGFVRLNTDGLRLQYRDATGTDAANFAPFSGQIASGAYAMASMRLANGVDLSAGLHTDGGSQYDARSVTPARSYANSATTKLGALQQFGQVFNAFDGTIAYARVYNRVLTTGELDQAYTEIRQIVDTRTDGAASFQTAGVAFRNVEARMNADRVQVQWDVSGYASGMTFEIDRQIVAGGTLTPWTLLTQVDGTAQAAEKAAELTLTGTTVAPSHVFTDAGAPDADRLQYRIRALDPDGELAMSKVVSIDRMPNRFAVRGVYPSPMRGRGTLALEIPEADRVDLRIFDILGRQVAHVVDAQLPAGRHRIPLALDGLASGIYFGRVAYAGSFRTVRIVIVH